MAAWVASELRGYPDNASVPPYRRIPLAVTGTITNGYRSLTNHIISLNLLTPEQKEEFTTMYVTDGIGAVTGWVAKDGDNANFGHPVPPEVCIALSAHYTHGYRVESAMRLPSAGAYRQIITEVRSRLLAFVLELDGRVQPSATAEEVRTSIGEQIIGDLFNGTVFGDNTTIIVGAQNATHVNNVIGNDFESLAKQLKKLGVKNEDIEELKTAIQDDEGAPEHEKKDFGSKVKSWFATMISKAGTEAWKVTATTAISGLYAALKAHYNWP